MKEIVFDGVPAELRPQFWQMCTGIDSYKSNYILNYYKTLCEADQLHWETYPNNHFAQVDKDLPRTFSSDPFYTKEVQESMRRIFRAYIWRNPTVGYI